jgi:UDP-N-acetyl-D-mannosaminuronic acid dehydrogenase
MQLAAAANNNFGLGMSAMLVNEGLPNFIVRHARTRWPLDRLRAGILGMAFKAESDDPRESLSYKLRKVLEYEAAECLCSDVHIGDPAFLRPEDLVERADVLFIGAPHRVYRDLRIPEGKPLVDVWNLFGRGVFSP